MKRLHRERGTPARQDRADLRELGRQFSAMRELPALGPEPKPRPFTAPTQPRVPDARRPPDTRRPHL